MRPRSELDKWWSIWRQQRQIRNLSIWMTPEQLIYIVHSFVPVHFADKTFRLLCADWVSIRLHPTGKENRAYLSYLLPHLRLSHKAGHVVVASESMESNQCLLLFLGQCWWVNSYLFSIFTRSIVNHNILLTSTEGSNHNDRNIYITRWWSHAHLANFFVVLYCMLHEIWYFCIDRLLHGLALTQGSLQYLLCWFSSRIPPPPPPCKINEMITNQFFFSIHTSSIKQNNRSLLSPLHKTFWKSDGIHSWTSCFSIRWFDWNFTVCTSCDVDYVKWTRNIRNLCCTPQ